MHVLLCMCVSACVRVRAGAFDGGCTNTGVGQELEMARLAAEELMQEAERVTVGRR